MAETKTKDRASTARDMIREEADGLAKKMVQERGEVRESKYADIDYRKGVIDGLNKAADLLGEGE